MPSRTETQFDDIAFKRQRQLHANFERQQHRDAYAPATSDQTTQIGTVSWGRVRDRVDMADKSTQCSAAPIVLQTLTHFELKSMAKAHGLITSGLKGAACRAHLGVPRISVGSRAVQALSARATPSRRLRLA
jgi:hypothetical protein